MGTLVDTNTGEFLETGDAGNLLEYVNALEEMGVVHSLRVYLSDEALCGGRIMVPWYAKGEVGEYLIHALDLIQDGQINDAISACLSVGMSDEEIDEFLGC